MKKIIVVSLLFTLIQSAYSLSTSDSAIFNIPDKYYTHIPHIVNTSHISVYLRYRHMYFGIIGLGRAYVAADGIRIKGIAVGAEWSKILGFSEVVIPDTPVDVDFNVSILKYINDSTAEYLAQAPFNTTRYTNSDTVLDRKSVM